MAEIICFDGRRKRYTAQGQLQKTAETNGDIVRFGNKYTRRSMIRMFLCGGSIRAVGRKAGGEAIVEQEIREALLDRGIAA